MPTQIIKADINNPTIFIKENSPAYDPNKLYVSELFCDTIQGENFTGVPSVFLRLSGCNLNCKWCDTTEIWRRGLGYDLMDLANIFQENRIIDRLRAGHHLVITGGSPLLQQNTIVKFLNTIINGYSLTPIIEVENECTIEPTSDMMNFVNIWNNSPKLSNSGIPKEKRYFPAIYEKMNKNGPGQEVWYKFVVSTEKDWEEILEDYIVPGYVNKNKVVLMPEGSTREELQSKYEWLVDLCCKENVRMTDRLHVTIWNKKIGV